MLAILCGLLTLPLMTAPRVALVFTVVAILAQKAVLSGDEVKITDADLKL